MTAATRTTAARLAAVAETLTVRDREVLDSLARLRLVTTKQVERLHFSDSTPLAGARGAHRTLVKLETAGLVARLSRRVGGVRAGSAALVWSLGLTGQHLLTRSGPAGGQQLRRPWTPSLAFVAHRLAITELFVGLVERDRRGEGELLRFEPEPDCWRPFTGAGGGRVVLKPDAFVMTGSDDYEHAWFVEVDHATESPLVLSRKTTVYLTYYRSGREQVRTGVFPLVTFSVPDRRRLETAMNVIRRLPEADRHLFRVALTAETADVLLRGET